jgi:hypothetical protein
MMLKNKMRIFNINIIFMNIIFIMEEFENSKISSITVISYFFNDSSEYLLKWIKNIKEVFSIKNGCECLNFCWDAEYLKYSFG